MSQTIRSKPLGYYVNTKRMLFKSFEEKYGSHMEGMSQCVKLQMRASLANYLALAAIYSDEDLVILMSEALGYVCNEVWDEYPWLEVLLQFIDESLGDIECFLEALTDQIRSDYH